MESLYYAREVIEAVAMRQGGTLMVEPEALVTEARTKALSTLRQAGKAEHLAGRVAERQMRDRMLSVIPDREAMISNGHGPLNVEIRSPYPTTLQRFHELVDASDLDAIIAGFPVRESGIIDVIAKAMRFIGSADYERAALATISADETLARSLRSKLGDLTAQLQ